MQNVNILNSSELKIIRKKHHYSNIMNYKY
jgi:hypothetical protein